MSEERALQVRVQLEVDEAEREKLLAAMFIRYVRQLDELTLHAYLDRLSQAHTDDLERAIDAACEASPQWPPTAEQIRAAWWKRVRKIAFDGSMRGDEAYREFLPPSANREHALASLGVGVGTSKRVGAFTKLDPRELIPEVAKSRST